MGDDKASIIRRLAWAEPASNCRRAGSPEQFQEKCETVYVRNCSSPRDSPARRWHRAAPTLSPSQSRHQENLRAFWARRDEPHLRALARVGINLFYFHGYNARKTSCARTTSARYPALLGRARAAIDEAEAQYRRENIQPPTRANPFPDATVVANPQALERLGREALEGLIRHQPVPENDRMTQRLEAGTLAALAENDAVLVGQAELLRSMLEGAAGMRCWRASARLKRGLARSRQRCGRGRRFCCEGIRGLERSSQTGPE